LTIQHPVMAALLQCASRPWVPLQTGWKALVEAVHKQCKWWILQWHHNTPPNITALATWSEKNTTQTTHYTVRTWCSSLGTICIWHSQLSHDQNNTHVWTWTANLTNSGFSEPLRQKSKDFSRNLIAFFKDQYCPHEIQTSL